jgi:hypothetical protein
MPANADLLFGGGYPILWLIIGVFIFAAIINLLRGD